MSSLAQDFSIIKNPVSGFDDVKSWFLIPIVMQHFVKRCKNKIRPGMSRILEKFPFIFLRDRKMI
jgi:hypothetical protein